MKRHISIFALLLSAFAAVEPAMATVKVACSEQVTLTYGTASWKLTVQAAGNEGWYNTLPDNSPLTAPANPPSDPSGTYRLEWFTLPADDTAGTASKISNCTKSIAKGNTITAAEIGTANRSAWAYYGNDRLIALKYIRQCTISTAVSPDGAGTVTGGATVDAGGSVTLEATANAGWSFSKWLKNGVEVDGESTLTIDNVTADATYTAEFTRKVNAITSGPTISNWTYGDTPKAPSAQAKYTGSTGMTYTYYDSSKASLGSSPPTNAGTYYIRATSPSSAEYVSATSDYVQFSISKKTINTDNVSFSNKSTVYTGGAQTVTASSVPAGVTVTYSGNSRTVVGEQTATAKFSATDSKNCQITTASKTAKLTITAATITGVTLKSTSVTYDGQAHQPQVESVTANGKTFSTSSTGWTVTCLRNSVEMEDFTTAGTITVKVTGTGNLTGSSSTSFTIGKKEISLDGVVFADLTATYDGTEKVIKAANVPSGVTATYSSNKRTAAGEQQARVTFEPNDPNHTVSLTQKLATLKIEQATITEVALNGTSATYDGESHKPTIGWVTANNKTFQNVNTGWDVTYLRNGAATGDFTSPGTITVKATGTSNLKGAASATFTINKATIESVTLATVSATYDGKPHQPVVNSVTASGKGFSSPNAGWTVAYTRGGAATTDFTKAGTITVTVTGKNGLSGTASATFTITPATITAIALNATSVTYDGQPHQPQVVSVTANGKTFTDVAIGWNVAYDKDDFTSVGRITVTANGKNNLSGSANATFEIKSKSITVTFDPNGGNAPSPASKTVQYPGTYGTLATCTRKGYDLTGWWTAKEGGTQITETTSVESTASQTFYARWKAKKYTLTIALKEGESYGAYKGPQNYQLPDPLIFGETNLNEIAVAYKKDDADFQGYFTSAGAMVYDAQGRNVMGALGEYWTNNYPIGTYCYDGNLTLSARFADPREHYEVTVTASPAEAGTVDPSGTATYVEGSNIVLTATENTGYSFWHWTKAGAEVSTAKEYPITVNANAEYTAVFTGNVYTVTFIGMGGLPAVLPVDVKVGEKWETFFPSVTYPGQRLVDWYSNVTYAESSRIDGKAKVPGTPPLALYAKWEEVPPVVTFADPEGGHESIQEPRTKEQPIGEPAKGTENWKRDGYWRDNSLDWNPPLTTPVTGDMTVNAKWTSIADVLDCTNLMFSVSGDWKPYAADYVKGDSCMRLESQNGVLSTVVTNSGTLTFSWKGGYLGSKATEFQVKVGSADPVTFTSTSEMDWVRTNLVISATGETKVEFSCRAFSDFCQIDFVTWDEGKGPEKSYTISFDANGGSGSMEKIVCKEGESFTFPDNDFTPPDAGATFLGWNENAECSGKTYSPADSLKATGDRTFYAKWRYTIAYKPGTHSRGQDYSDAKDHGASVMLRDREYSHNSGALYVQDGWSVNEDESTLDYALKETYSENASITLYPHWKSVSVSDALDCPALEFSANGGWSIIEDPLAVNGSCMRLATYDEANANAITVEIREAGKLSFDWKGVYAAKPTKMNVFIGDMETPAVICAATPEGTAFATFGPYEIAASSDNPVVVKFAGVKSYFSGCSLDHVVWTPEGGGEPVPGDPVEVTAAGVVDGVFSLTIPTDPGTDYGVWTNADLTVDSWGLMGEPQKGEGKPMEFKWTIFPGFQQLFFRAHKVEYKK